MARRIAVLGFLAALVALTFSGCDTLLSSLGDTLLGGEETEDADSTLASLTISHGELSPAFSPDTYLYTATIAAEAVESVEVSGVPRDPEFRAVCSYPTDYMSGSEEDRTATVRVYSEDVEAESHYYILFIVAPNQLPAPTFSPSGGTFGGNVDVTINTPAPDATIHYTLDGSTPNHGSAVFSDETPIVVNEALSPLTIKAIAAAPGVEDSPVATATYTVSATATGSITVEYTSALSDAVDAAAPIRIHLSGAAADSSVQTASSGAYTFSGLASGSYVVQIFHDTNGDGLHSIGAEPVASDTHFLPAGGTYTMPFHLEATSQSGGIESPQTPQAYESDGAIAVSWSWWYSSDSIDGFKIYRREGDGAGHTLVHTADAADREWYDDSVIPTLTYHYQITAYAGSDESLPTSETSSEVTSAAGPSQVLFDSSTYDSITLTWDLVSGAVSYNIYRGTQDEWPDTETLVDSVAADVSTVTDDSTDLEPSRGYYYTVTAVYSTSVESEKQNPPIYANTTAPVEPPASVDATVLASDRVELTWDLSDGAESYRVSYDVKESAFPYEANASTVEYGVVPAPPVTIDGLDPYTYHHFHVTAIDDDTAYESWEQSAEKVRTLVAPPIIDSFEIVLHFSLHKIQFNVSEFPTGASSFNIYMSTDGGETYEQHTGTYNTNTLEPKVLLPSEYGIYHYKLYSRDAFGANASEGSEPIRYVRVLMSGVEATDNLIDKVEISWPAYQDAAYYTVSRKDETGEYVLLSGAEHVAELSYADAPPTTREEYDYRVEAYDADGLLIAYGYGYNGQMLGIESPTNLVASDAVFDEVNLTWDAVADADHYVVYRSSAPDTGYEVVAGADGSITTEEYADTPPEAGLEYYYAVSAVHASGAESAPSAYDGGTVARLTAPTYVHGSPHDVLSGDYTELLIDADHVEIRWTGDPNAASYKVYRANDDTGVATYEYIGETAGAETYYFDFVGADSGAIDLGWYYFYRIVAVSPAGYESPMSDWHPYSSGVAYDGSDEDAKPRNLVASEGTASDSIELSWDPPVGAPGATYTIYRRNTYKDIDATNWGPLETVVDEYDGTTYVDDTVDADSRYYYTVFARRAAGNVGYVGEFTYGSTAP